MTVPTDCDMLQRAWAREEELSHLLRKAWLIILVQLGLLLWLLFGG